MAEGLDVGVTYLPAETGIHQWLEPRPARAAQDLQLIRAAGFLRVRLHLPWDAFMPSHRRVARRRLGELGGLLEEARALGMRCELVLFAQSHGDCLQLPAYAVDRSRPRPGVRVLTDGSVVAGGPRDLYADPLMLEACDLLLRSMLDAFANHPAVALWDLGHDPASTLRPRRTADLAAWTELMASVVRRRGDQVRLTLGAGDVLTARGVRLAAVAPHVDALGLVLPAQRLPVLGDVRDSLGPGMTLALAARLAAGDDGPVRQLAVVTGVAVDDDPGAPPPAGATAPRAGADPAPPRWDVVPLTPPEGARRTAEVFGRLGELGAGGFCATSWCTGGPRTMGAPPWDLAPSLARHGIAEPDGRLREHGAVWAALSRREVEAQPPVPWPDTLDAEQYYANLPDSARDLYVAWSRGLAAPEE